MDTLSESDICRRIEQAHALYCQLTGQNILLRFNWHRSWFELLRWGFTLEDVGCVVRYLQKEIRGERRNIGALKLSNLLQPDRFEEDLNISRARLRPPRPENPTKSPLPPTPPPQDLATPSEAATQFAQLRRSVQISPPTPPGNRTSHQEL